MKKEIKKEVTKVAEKIESIRFTRLILLKSASNQPNKKAAPVDRTNIFGRFIGSQAVQGFMTKVEIIPVRTKILVGVIAFKIDTQPTILQISDSGQYCKSGLVLKSALTLNQKMDSEQQSRGIDEQGLRTNPSVFAIDLMSTSINLKFVCRSVNLLKKFFALNSIS